MEIEEYYKLLNTCRLENKPVKVKINSVDLPMFKNIAKDAYIEFVSKGNKVELRPLEVPKETEYDIEEFTDEIIAEPVKRKPKSGPIEDPTKPLRKDYSNKEQYTKEYDAWYRAYHKAKTTNLDA